MKEDREPRDSESGAMLQLALYGCGTPSEMSAPYDFKADYLGSRIRYMKGHGWIKRPARGRYELTAKGWRVLLRAIPITLDALLAYRVFSEEWTTLGREDVIAVRLASEEVATFEAADRAVEVEEGVGMELEPRETFGSFDVVEELVEDARPDA